MPSEAGQDNFVRDHYKGAAGFFVEVGAHDGNTLSNTAALEAEGWQGICIEPHPRLYSDLVRRRRAWCINAACADVQGQMLFNLREVEGWSGLARTQPELECQQILVATRTLTSICFEFGVKRIDYLSIDTEGGDLNVLRGLDFSQVSVGVISVEVDKVSGAGVRELLEANGFEYATHLGVDDIYTGRKV